MGSRSRGRPSAAEGGDEHLGCPDLSGDVVDEEDVEGGTVAGVLGLFSGVPPSSAACEQEMIVPQGSILSVTLFCLKISSILALTVLYMSTRRTMTKHISFNHMYYMVAFSQWS